MKNSLIAFIVIVLGLSLLSGCLSIEKKEYRLQLTGKNSGKGSIKYINIVSIKDDDKDVSMKDFAELITDYLQGDKFTSDLPNLKVNQKRMFEENGQLCAEVTFDFDSLSYMKIFQYDKDSPYMLLVKESYSSEEYLESNGEYNLNNLPIIFWKKTCKDFNWSAKVSYDSTKAISLLSLYKDWEKNNKK